jgi:N6-L-threonylcarbamoyladenine synthase
MRILGIDTSCDETSAAIVEDGTKSLSNVIASQVEIHARYGGVVPEVASRQHILSIVPVVNKAMEDSGTDWSHLDAIAVTYGPGLAGALLIGVNMAKAASFARKLPLIGVNHLEGHIYAAWLTGKEIEFPLVCLIVSGGHSDLILMRGHGDYTLLGQTRDDAAGEAFDKSARILGLGYPGGPAIERIGKEGVASIELPRAWLKGTYDFSFSGLKTALLHLVEGGKIALAVSDKKDNLPTVADAAASFQEAVIDVLVGKTVVAAREYGVRQVIMVGGVAANRTLAKRMTDASPIPVVVPTPSLCTDNGAMIAACGYYYFRAGKRSDLALDVVPNLRLI